MPLTDRSKGGFSLGDYVEVKDRIRLFYEAFPTGSICTEAAWVSVDDDVPRVWVRAVAYRSPDDSHPGVGHSWMQLPGTTSYTKGSELENTETSAWGRAIAATGIGLSKSIASADEVRSKDGQDLGRPELERRAEGLVGTVSAGKPPVDLQLRQTPEGPAFGFKLAAGNRKGYQALAIGPLADSLAIAHAAEEMTGATVTVWGHIEMIPWDKDGKPMPPFARIRVERVQTPGWTLPDPDRDTNTTGGHEHWGDDTPPVDTVTVPMGLVDDDLSDLPEEWARP